MAKAKKSVYEIPLQRRTKFWKQLKDFFPDARISKKNQYFEFEYSDLALRVDVYIQTKDIDNYGGNVVVSFDAVAFKGSGFIVPNNITPEIHNDNDTERIYFFKSINLKTSKGFAEAIKWICGVVVTIASLYNAVNCE
jgi:hypothetical protein